MSSTEVKVERMMVEMSRKLLSVQALLTHRTEQLVASRQAERALRQRLQQLEPAALPKAHNRKGTAGYDVWLRKFRLKNTPRLKAMATAAA